MKSAREISRASLAIVLITVMTSTTLGLYASFTYPRTSLSFNVAFTIGADIEEREFEIPLLHKFVQVEVVIGSGAAIWNAKISLQEEIIWSHTDYQGEQTIYKSEWIEFPNKRYNFTFTTTGFGSLEAEIKIHTKGGIW